MSAVVSAHLHKQPQQRLGQHDGGDAGRRVPTGQTGGQLQSLGESAAQTAGQDGGLVTDTLDQSLGVQVHTDYLEQRYTVREEVLENTAFLGKRGVLAIR